MPVDVSIQLIKIIQKWLSNTKTFAPSLQMAVITYIKKLFTDDQIEKGFKLAQTLFAIKIDEGNITKEASVIKYPQNDSIGYYYQMKVKELYSILCKHKPIATIDFFCKTDEEKSKIRLDQVIEYGQPFLVDAIGNDLSVCMLTRRKFKLPTGRVVNAKFDRTIIDDCRSVYGTPLNQYYVIPDIFIDRGN